MIKAVIFDFSDTIALSSATINRITKKKIVFESFKKNKLVNNYAVFAAAKKLAEIDYKIKLDGNTKKYGHGFFDELIYFHIYHRWPTGGAKQKMRNIAIDYHRAYLKYIRLAPGALEILNYLKRKDIMIFLISNENKENIEKRLQKLKISAFFNSVIVSSDVGREKSSLIPFKIALSELNIHPKNILVVGDRKDEDTYAKKLGMITATINHGISRKYSKKIIEPDYVLKNFGQIKKIVQDNEDAKYDFNYFSSQWPISRKKYAKNAFKNEFDKIGVPEGERDFRSMDIARFWIKMFRQIKLKENSSVLEFCTGQSPKIIYALGLIGFRGKYTSTDTDIQISKKIKSIISHLKIKYSYNIRSTIRPSDSTFNVVIGNHAVDDIFLIHFCSALKINYFDYIEDNYSKKLTTLLISNKKEFEKAVNLTAKDIFTYTKKLVSGGYLLLSNYPPYIDVKRKDAFRIKQLEQAFGSVCKRIQENGFSVVPVRGLHSIRSSDNKPKYWTIFRKI